MIGHGRQGLADVRVALGQFAASGQSVEFRVVSVHGVDLRVASVSGLVHSRHRRDCPGGFDACMR